MLSEQKMIPNQKNMSEQPEMLDKALEIGSLLDNKKDSNTVVLDMRGMNIWTDFIVISTVVSSGQLKGVVRRLKEYLKENSIHIMNSHKQTADDGWELIDCGSIVVNLMSKEKREFYDLERLWFAGNLVYGSTPER